MVHEERMCSHVIHRAACVESYGQTLLKPCSNRSLAADQYHPRILPPLFSASEAPAEATCSVDGYMQPGASENKGGFLAV